MVFSGLKGSSSSRLAVAVVKEAYKRIGYDMDIQWLTGKKALEKSNSGENDGELQRIDGISRKFPNLIQVPIPINFLQGSAFTVIVNSLAPYSDFYSF